MAPRAENLVSRSGKSLAVEAREAYVHITVGQTRSRALECSARSIHTVRWPERIWPMLHGLRADTFHKLTFIAFCIAVDISKLPRTYATGRQHFLLHLGSLPIDVFTALVKR